jgi:hypothetical protein
VIDTNSILAIIIFWLVFFASLFNALMDLSSENIFKKDWWNKESWKNKWKLDADGNLLPCTVYWWYLWLYKPEYQERFPYSSTILVFLTDGWHFFQFLFHSSWQAAISAPTYLFENNIWVCFLFFAIIKVTFSTFFEVFYSRIKKKLE